MVFGASFVFLIALAPAAPFNRELGVCEAGAVRDVLAGNLILPHYEPGVMVQVPPLYWWTAALSVRWLGMTEVAMRLPSLIAAALTCAFLFSWCAAAFDRRTALWSVAILALCHFFADAARQPRMDAMLTMFVTGALLALERGLSAQGSRRAAFLAAGAAMIALGILTKSALAIGLVGLTMLLFLLVRRRLRQLLDPGLIAAFAAALAAGLLWYLFAYEVGGRPFLQWQVTEGLLGRFTGTERLCANPFYYYVPHLISGALPWSLYIPALAWLIWRRRASIPEPLVFALCWFVLIFLFFSISRGRCLVYILPAFPPLAVMLGYLMARARLDRDEEPIVARLFDAGSAVIGVGGLGVTILTGVLMVFGLPPHLVSRLHPSDQQFAEILFSLAAGLSPGFLLWLTGWTAGAVMALLGLRRLNQTLQASGVLILSVAATLFWFGTITPANAAQISLKSFAAQIDRILPVGVAVDYVGRPDCDVAFYSTHPIRHVPQLGRVEMDTRYLLFWQGAFQSLSPAERARLEVMAQSAPVDRHGYRLLVRRREPEAR